VAGIHTHPPGSAEGVSGGDRNWAIENGIPLFVVTPRGVLLQISPQGEVSTVARP